MSEHEIRAMVDRETAAWGRQDAEALVSLFHPDMVWPCPPDAKSHDPASWVLRKGMGAEGRVHDSLYLLKGDPDRVRAPGTTETPGLRQGRSRIRCPRCAWQPGRQDRWMCVCLHAWNTFDTRGVCPGCGRQWTETQCLRCAQWSPHDDWYEDEPESP